MSPIKTIVRNLTNEPKTIYWAGPKPVNIPAGGERIIDFEVWSAANEQLRKGIVKAAGTGAFGLSLLVLGKNGEYTQVEYAPELTAPPAVPVVYSDGSTPEPEPKKEEIPSQDIPKEPMKMKIHDFNVIATSQESKEQMEKLGARPAAEIEDEVQLDDGMPTIKAEGSKDALEKLGAEKVEEEKPAKKARAKK